MLLSSLSRIFLYPYLHTCGSFIYVNAIIAMATAFNQHSPYGILTFHLRRNAMLYNTSIDLFTVNRAISDCRDIGSNIRLIPPTTPLM